MKYESFRIVRGAAIVLVIVGCVYGVSQCSSKKSSNTYSNQQNRTESRSAPTTSSPPHAPEPAIDYNAATTPVSARDKRILEAQKGATDNGLPDENGLKQSMTSSDFKLDMRSDTKKGYAYWNRVKVDYNKNKKWDEKWSFGKDGKVTRQVAPQDDEEYSIQYELSGEVWKRK